MYVYSSIGGSSVIDWGLSCLFTDFHDLLTGIWQYHQVSSLIMVLLLCHTGTSVLCSSFSFTPSELKHGRWILVGAIRDVYLLGVVLVTHPILWWGYFEIPIKPFPHPSNVQLVKKIFVIEWEKIDSCFLPGMCRCSWWPTDLSQFAHNWLQLVKGNRFYLLK